MLRRLGNYWFLLGLGLVVGIGLTSHSLLLPIAELSWLMTVIVFCVMAMMAAPVPIEMVRQTLSRPWPALLASMVNLGIVPLMGWVGAWWLQPDLAGGLIVATAVPSTLTSAAVMTRRAGGDETVSILTTLLTNISCVVITPLWIIVLLGVSVELSMTDMMANLTAVVLLPIVLVQLARAGWPAFSRMADRARGRLSVLCQLGILSMVLIGSVQMGSRWMGSPLESDSGGNSVFEWSQIFAVSLLGVFIHLAAFGLTWVLAARTGIPIRQRKAASFSASQKTLMIGLNLAIHCGVNILPMVTYHVFQLFVDAFIAEKWSASDPPTNPRGGSDAQSSSAERF
jgi:solute carrier family 10 (sodium/bile acid cotransporter), member 7